MSACNKWLSRGGNHQFIDKLRNRMLTMTEASTTRKPDACFSCKSGSTTPYLAPRGDIAAVPTMWPDGNALARMKSSSSLSDVAFARGPAIPSTNFFHAGAAKNLLALLIDSRRAITSKLELNIPGLISGAARTSLEPSCTVPPVQYECKWGREDMLDLTDLIWVLREQRPHQQNDRGRNLSCRSIKKFC